MTISKKPGPRMATATGNQDAAAIRAKLAARQQHEYEHRDDFGGKKDIWDTAKMATLGVKIWRPKGGLHRYDVIPYYVGSQHPILEAGNPDYKLDIWVHRNIGANEDTILCLAKTYNSECPICELIRAAKAAPEEYPDVDTDNIRAIRICIYNVISLDKGEERVIKLFQMAHFIMEKHIVAISKDEETGEEVHYVDPEIGKSIIFERKGEGRNNTQYFGYRFGNRVQPYKMDIMNKAFQLDELLAIPTYDEVAAILRGSVYEGIAEEPLDDGTGEEAGEQIPEFEEPLDDGTGEEAGNEAPGEIECPSGGTFAADFNMYNECEGCIVFVECEAANNPPPPEKKKPTPKTPTPTPKTTPKAAAKPAGKPAPKIPPKRQPPPRR